MKNKIKLKIQKMSFLIKKVYKNNINFKMMKYKMILKTMMIQKVNNIIILS